jgi:hypothetical protein
MAFTAATFADKAEFGNFADAGGIAAIRRRPTKSG